MFRISHLAYFGRDREVSRSYLNVKLKKSDSQTSTRVEFPYYNFEIPHASARA
jgi:hypothetical protein